MYAMFTVGIFYQGTCCKYIFFSKSVNIEDGKEVPSQFQKKMWGFCVLCLHK